MTGAQDERIVKAVEVLAITAAQLAANWIANHNSSRRANDLIEHVQPKLEWQMRRWGE